MRSFFGVVVSGANISDSPYVLLVVHMRCRVGKIGLIGLIVSLYFRSIVSKLGLLETIQISDAFHLPFTLRTDDIIALTHELFS